jgi:hypothetical protein
MPRGHWLEDRCIRWVGQALLDVRDDVIHGEAVGELAALAGVGGDDFFLEGLEGRVEVGLVLARAYRGKKGREGGREGGRSK